MLKKYIWLAPIVLPLTVTAKDVDIGIPVIKRDIDSYLITTNDIPASAVKSKSERAPATTTYGVQNSNKSTTSDVSIDTNSVVDTLRDKPIVLRPLSASCVNSASEFYGVHQDILYALLLTEGGTVGEASKENKNGTKDLNLFQMNEGNLPELAKEFGITKEQFMNDGCLGVAVAARHLLRSIEGKPIPTDGHSYLKYLALYHSANEPWNEIYANKLQSAFEFLAKIDAKNNARKMESLESSVALTSSIDDGVQ